MLETTGGPVEVEVEKHLRIDRAVDRLRSAVNELTDLKDRVCGGSAVCTADGKERDRPCLLDVLDNTPAKLDLLGQTICEATKYLQSALFTGSAPAGNKP